MDYKIPLGMKVGLGPGDFVLVKGAEPPPIFGPCLLWSNDWMDQDATWYGGRPRPRRLCIRWAETLQLPRKRAQPPTQFLAHVYCGQTAGWINMPLGTEVNLGPGDVVLDGVAVPLPLREAHSPVFGPCLL